jgi:hypothetical protein
MIDPLLTIRVANRTIYLALGKAMTIALLSLLVGLGIYADDARSAKEARNLTFDQYKADYQKYRDKLAAKSVSAPVIVVASLVLVGGSALLYEALGFGFGWALGLLADSPKLRDPSETAAP